MHGDVKLLGFEAGLHQAGQILVGRVWIAQMLVAARQGRTGAVLIGRLRHAVRIAVVHVLFQILQIGARGGG